MINLINLIIKSIIKIIIPILFKKNKKQKIIKFSPNKQIHLI